ERLLDLRPAVAILSPAQARHLLQPRALSPARGVSRAVRTQSRGRSQRARRTTAIFHSAYPGAPQRARRPEAPVPESAQARATQAASISQQATAIPRVRPGAPKERKPAPTRSPAPAAATSWEKGGTSRSRARSARTRSPFCSACRRSRGACVLDI